MIDFAKSTHGGSPMLRDIATLDVALGFATRDAAGNLLSVDRLTRAFTPPLFAYQSDSDPRLDMIRAMRRLVRADCFIEAELDVAIAAHILRWIRQQAADASTETTTRLALGVSLVDGLLRNVEASA